MSLGSIALDLRQGKLSRWQMKLLPSQQPGKNKELARDKIPSSRTCSKNWLQPGPSWYFLPFLNTIIKLGIYQWIKHSLYQSLLAFIHFPETYRLAARVSVSSSDSNHSAVKFKLTTLCIWLFSPKWLLALIADLSWFEKFQVMFVCPCVMHRIP